MCTLFNGVHYALLDVPYVVPMVPMCPHVVPMVPMRPHAVPNILASLFISCYSPKVSYSCSLHR
jgi:hypothetical protein